MVNRDTGALHVTAVTRVEEPERLRCRSRQNLSNNRQTGRVRIDGQKRAHLPIEGEMERGAFFRVFAD